MRGTSIETCDLSTIGNGKCDYTNNMVSNQCQMDGGDCCLTTCISNCLNKQGGALTGANIPYSNPSGRTGECASMCGVRASPMTNCPYLCLDDGYVGVAASYTSWCSHTRGTQSTMSNCYSTFGDIVTVLQECLMDERSHGNAATSSTRCGNQTLDCTFADVTNKIDGCHLHPNSCTGTGCCSLAVANGWINPGTKVMPSRCDLYTACAGNSDCFPLMAKCARNNKACQGVVACVMRASGTDRTATSHSVGRAARTADAWLRICVTVTITGQVIRAKFPYVPPPVSQGKVFVWHRTPVNVFTASRVSSARMLDPCLPVLTATL